MTDNDSTHSAGIARGKYVVVPRHDEKRRETLPAIIKEAGLSKEEFMKLLS